MAHLQRRAVHMEPRTWPSQTCFVSLLGFVSFSTYFPIRNQLQLDFVERAAHVVNWMHVDGKLGGRGPALCFCGGLGVDKPRSLGGLTPVLNKSQTQCYHDPRRPGSAVRMFMRPFVWAECAQHIHVNLLPGCFQISRANPKRPQLLKRGFVLETHEHCFFRGSGPIDEAMWGASRGQNLWKGWLREASRQDCGFAEWLRRASRMFVPQTSLTFALPCCESS